MKKRCLLILFAVMVAAGCAKLPDEEPARQDGVRIQDGMIQGTESDQLFFDAQIKGDKDKKTDSVFHAKLSGKLTEELIREVLYPGEGVIVNEDETSIGMHPDQERPDSLKITTMYKDLDVIAYSSQKATRKSYTYYLTLATMNSELEPPHYTTEIPVAGDDVEFADFSKQDAIEASKELLDQIGLNITEEPNLIYAVPHEWLMKMEEEKELSLPEIPGRESITLPITEEDDLYVIMWPCGEDGMTVFSGNYPMMAQGSFRFRDGLNRGSSVVVLQSREGTEYIASWGFQFDVTGKEEEEQLIPLEELVPVVKTYYENELLTEEHFVQYAEYAHFPVLQNPEEPDKMKWKYDMIPGWCFQIRYIGLDGESTYWDYVYINALTGELIP